MEIVQLKKFKDNIDSYLSLVIKDKEEVFITNKDKVIVMVDADDYEALNETLKIYRNSYLYNKLMKAKRSKKALLKQSKEYREVLDEIGLKS
jgi:prevent-host-death family protein